MSGLVLTRKSGQSVLMTDKFGSTETLEIIYVSEGFCKMRIHSNLQTECVKLNDSMQTTPNVSVKVTSIGRGQAKLQFTAPRDVHILRTELA